MGSGVTCTGVCSVASMRRGIVHWGLGIAFAALLTGCGSSEDKTKTQKVAEQGADSATCAHQSGASFHPPGADDISFGPLRFAGLREAEAIAPNELRKIRPFKSPALLSPRHTVTVSIDTSARSFARLSYVHRQSDPPVPTFSRLSHTIRFVSCSAQRAQSEVVPGNWSGGAAPANLPGKPVTFWSGFFFFKKRGCVPLTIRIDHEPARHWRLPVGVDSCART